MNKSPLIRIDKYRICLAGSKSDDFINLYHHLVEQYSQHDMIQIDNYEKLLKEISKIHIVITNLSFTSMSGHKVIESMRHKNKDVQIIVVDDRRLANRPGLIFAQEVNAFIPSYKHFATIEEHLKLAVEYLDSMLRLAKDSDLFIKIGKGMNEFVCADESTKELFVKAEKYSKTKGNILILGETGTGKDILAEYIHLKSGRVGSFQSLNCANISSSFAESELFGHVKGAYTDAKKDKIGKLKLADKGTIFLDEIGELHPEVQSKLLRFLDNGKFTRMGSNEVETADVSVVSATNKDIKENKILKKDFYARIGPLRLYTKPLRDRPLDLKILIDHYLDYYNVELGKCVRLTKSALEYLWGYNYPLNIRELKAMIMGSIALAVEEVDESLLKDQVM